VFPPLQIHTKRRNKLEHKRLNKLVFVSYNRKITNRFLKLRELGSKGKRCNPLVLEEFQWENEWVDASCDPVHQRDDITWAQVDEAISASQGLRSHNLPRAAVAKRRASSVTPAMARKRKNPRPTSIPIEEIHEDEELSEDTAVEEDYSPTKEIEEEEYDDEEEDGGGGATAAGGFQVDENLL
jgi:hypothetical protein